MKPDVRKSFQLLGLSEDTTLDEVKKAYRKLAKSQHPDKGGDEEEFKKTNAAYECLSEFFNEDKSERESFLASFLDMTCDFTLSVANANLSRDNIHAMLDEKRSFLDETDQMRPVFLPSQWILDQTQVFFAVGQPIQIRKNNQYVKPTEDVIKNSFLLQKNTRIFLDLKLAVKYSAHLRIGAIDDENCWQPPVFVVEISQGLKREQLTSARFYRRTDYLIEDIRISFSDQLTENLRPLQGIVIFDNEYSRRKYPKYPPIAFESIVLDYVLSKLNPFDLEFLNKHITYKKNRIVEEISLEQLRGLFFERVESEENNGDENVIISVLN